MSEFHRQLDKAARDSFFRRVAGTDMIYTDSEMQKMFGPYLSEGKHDGLSVREIKLIETVQYLRANALESKTAALKKEVEELKDFRNTRDIVAE